jgi:hypothetical protein
MTGHDTVLRLSAGRRRVTNFGMAKEKKLPIGKSISLDQRMAERLVMYRSERPIGSENKAIRKLLDLGLEVGEKRLARGPAELVTEAKALLREASGIVSGEATRNEQAPKKLPTAKRINLDQRMADRLADYRSARRIGSENQAFRELLELGLEIAEKDLARSQERLVNAAKALLTEAIRMLLPPIFELSATALEDEQDPLKLLRGAEELLTDDGELRGGFRRNGKPEKPVNVMHVTDGDLTDFDQIPPGKTKVVTHRKGKPLDQEAPKGKEPARHTAPRRAQNN